MANKKEKPVKKYSFYCPQCGKSGVSLCESTTKYFFGLKCEKCGEFKILFDDKYGFFVEELDVPYLINAKDNVATKFHKFDFSDYSDEKEAVREKIALADKILELLDGTMLYEYLDEVYAEYLKLLEKAVGLEMKEYFGEYLFEMMGDYVEAVSKGEKNDPGKIKYLYENSDFETKSFVGLEICAMNEVKYCGINNEFVYDSLYEGRKDGSIEKNHEKYGERLMVLAQLFEEMKDRKHFLLVVDEAIENAEKMEPDSVKRHFFLTIAKADSMKYADREKATELFNELYECRENNPFAYIEAVVVYGLRFHKDLLIRKELAEKIEFGFDWIIENFDELETDELCNLTLRLNHIRYLITDDEINAKNIIDIAKETLVKEEPKPYIFMALRDLLFSESLPKKYKDKIIRICKKCGCSKEEIIRLGDDFQKTKGYF